MGQDAAVATLLHLSDTHLGATPGGPVMACDPDARLATVLAAWTARGESADLVVHSGDVTDDEHPDAVRRVDEALATLGAPVLAVGGNHDAPTVALGGPDTAEVGAWRVLGARTARPGQIHGTLDVPALLHRLDALDDRPTVLVVHHPPRSRSTHEWFQLDGADALLDALAARPHVRAVLSGHLHDAFALPGPGDLVLLGGPSTAQAIAHEGEAMRFGEGLTGARVVRLHDDGRLEHELLEA
ncbi:hypothetical protein GKE82_01570 [Conexibacter sp. W3-3-2]|nr:hypothetical protein [Conexibacter sp. W3-3-2]